MGNEPVRFPDFDPLEGADSDSRDGAASAEGSPRQHQTNPPQGQILEELQRVLDSTFFRSSKRSSQFLDFIVHYRLNNPSEPLKERTIGTTLFGRPADYATGDDSVVRVQAREVRRKLEKYYQFVPDEGSLRIELPLGSYLPDFITITPPEPSPAAPDFTPRTEQGPHPVEPVVATEPSLSPPDQFHKKPRSRRKYFLFGSVAALVCVLVAAWGGWIYSGSARNSTLREFWAPALAAKQPLLICLAKPVLYRPSEKLYLRSEKWPGEFSHIVDRMNNPPNLKPNAVIHWRDMERYYDFGVAEGDVEAAVNLSDFLVRRGKSNEVRIGNGYDLEDIRSFPSVIIGAFSNPIAMQLISGLHFSFMDGKKGIRIQEAGPHGRSWHPRNGSTGEDFGLVTRLRDSNTGQFTVLVAGTEASGSAAAAELVTDPHALARALRKAPKDWPQKNVQIVLSTSVTNYVTSPPKIIAVYVW